MSETPEMSIYERTFAPSVKTDAILLVDGKKLHVNKALLSYHSVRFKALFNTDSDENSVPEVPIEDVNFEDFATLLSLVQDNPIEITKQNAESLLELADRFLLPGPKSQVELFISTSPEFERIKKLEIAAKSEKIDAILVVEGKKIHVNKYHLSYNSDYFKTLFNGEFKEKSMPEIEIKDVKFEDFAVLLSLIQHSPMAITKQNTENLLELADRFLLPVPKSLVENFIWTSSEFEQIEKLKLADKYKMDVLLERVKMSATPTISIYETTFAKSDKTDAILVVGEKKLHVNKALLSYHSDYFNTLFNGEFKEKSMPEIPIEDVDFEDFATLLSLVHHNPMELSEGNAEDILKLADRFFLPAARRHVELFIWTSAEFSSLEKLTIADKYNLDTLLQKTLDWFSADRDAFYEFRFGSGNHLSTELKSRLFDIFTEKHLYYLLKD